MEFVGWVLILAPFVWIYFQVCDAQSGDRRSQDNNYYGPSIGPPPS
jgi:hypothetical protein